MRNLHRNRKNQGIVVLILVFASLVLPMTSGLFLILPENDSSLCFNVSHAFSSQFLREGFFAFFMNASPALVLSNSGRYFSQGSRSTLHRRHIKPENIQKISPDIAAVNLQTLTSILPKLHHWHIFISESSPDEAFPA